jgi:hypothetical protein
VDVQDFPDIKSGFSVIFKFSPDNPHFTNRYGCSARGGSLSIVNYNNELRGQCSGAYGQAGRLILGTA